MPPLRKVVEAARAGIYVHVVLRAAAGGSFSPQPLSLPLALLSDACLCALCRDARTGQRLPRHPEARGDPRPSAKAVAATPGGDLRIEWALPSRSPAGAERPHVTELDAEELAQLCSASEDDGRYRDPASFPPFQPDTWWRPNGGKFDPCVAHADWMASDNEALRKGLRLVRDEGFVRVDGVPATEAATEAALRRIAPPLATIYGEGMWRTEVLPLDDSKNTDTAFGRAALAPHTDGCYMHSPPGLQAFHCLSQDDGGGGASTLVDGAALAKYLHTRHSTAWKYLSDPLRLRLAYAHVDAKHELRHERGVFTLNANGSFRSVHFNEADRVGPPIIGAGAKGFGAQGHGAALRALGALHILREALEDPELGFLRRRFLLEPGQLLIFDNSRVLHGREAILGNGRVLSGAYVGEDMWRSRLRVLEREAGVEGEEHHGN